MSINDHALTIPAAAAHVTFSTSTLRSYVQAWEEAFGPLPRDNAGHTRLVKPLLTILNDAHGLWPTRLDHWGRLREVLTPDPATKVLRIVEAYRNCSSSQVLVGIESFGAKVTSAVLLNLVERMNDIEYLRPEDKRELIEAARDEVAQLQLELADFAVAHAEGLKSLAAAFQQFADRATKAARDFGKHAGDE